MTVDRRIFVVGVPRSGTTLVQSLLAAHTTMTSFTESHFFSRHFSLLFPRPILTKEPEPRLREFLAENDEDPPDAARWFEAQGRWALPFRSDRAARQFLRVLDELTLRRGKSSWIEKTPRHLRYVPFLERLSGPHTRFVHVIRDGLEAVSSLYVASRSWEVHYDLEACVQRWNDDVGFSLGRVGSPNDYFVVYEELTSRPEAALRRLLAEIGLAWEPEILERYARASSRLVTGQETWKAEVGRAIRRSGTSDRVLSAEQREWVTGSLRHELYAQIAEAAS